jgi:hypothetical protein
MSRFGNAFSRIWFGPQVNERLAGAVPMVPDSNANFGPGLGHQPQAEVALRENLGLADAATRAIANRIASLELEVTMPRIGPDGTRDEEVIDDHPLAQLLQRPHPDFSSWMLLRLSAQYIITTGEAYLFKGRPDGLATLTQGPIAWIYPYPPGTVVPQIEGGQIVAFRVTDANGNQFSMARDDVIRTWIPDPENPWRGEGYIGPSALVIDSHKFAMEHIRRHYQHDATPKTVLEGDPAAKLPGPEQRKRFGQDWSTAYHGRHSGPGSGTPRILPPGWKAHQLDAAASKDHTPFLKEFRDDLLMQVGGVPRAVLGQVVSGDRSSAETELWNFDVNAVSPITTLMEDAYNLQLAPEFGNEVRVRFKPFVAPDKEYELKREAQDVEHGVRTINKVLRDRQEDEVEWGDEPIVLSSLKKYDPNAPPETVATPPGNQTEGIVEDEPTDEEDEERVIRDAYAKIRRLDRARKRRKAS